MRWWLLLLMTGLAAASPLELQVERAKDAGFRLFIVNRGSVPHKVVKTGDGSEAGWREPVVRWSGEVWRDGRWVPLQAQAVGRCGLYDANWHKDVVEVAPGARLDLGPWASYPRLELPAHGRVRLTVTYLYTAGQARKGGHGVVNPGPMGEIGPFTLTSKPLEFTR